MDGMDACRRCGKIQDYAKLDKGNCCRDKVFCDQRVADKLFAEKKQREVYHKGK